jgi:hypothetical protein
MSKLTLSPPSVEYAPFNLQKELIEMQQMTIDELSEE